MDVEVCFHSEETLESNLQECWMEMVTGILGANAPTGNQPTESLERSATMRLGFHLVWEATRGQPAPDPQPFAPTTTAPAAETTEPKEPSPLDVLITGMSQLQQVLFEEERGDGD